MFRTSSRPPWRFLIFAAVAAILTWLPQLAPAQTTPPAGDVASAKALDQKIVQGANKGSELLANLTHLSDVIGPRLTGSAALKKANDWAAGKMKAYGLVNVHHEPFPFP